MDRLSRIFVAGHRGLVGSAIVRDLHRAGHTTILTATRTELDLRRQVAVDAWFATHRPEYVYLVAGTVGGIVANMQRPADLVYDNLMIHATVVQAACRIGVKKLLSLGSSCTYPRDCPQPMAEDRLLTGALEPTSEPYAIAKIAGMMLCRSYRRQYRCNFVSAIPAGVYGPNDNFGLTSSHVLSAMIRKFHDARSEGRDRVVLWGSGRPRREFLHVDDLAEACRFLMQHYEEDGPINVGTGEDVTVEELACRVREVVHPAATVEFDATKPDGVPRKLLDVRRLHHLGWHHAIGLREGIEQTYRWFVAHPHDVRGDGDFQVEPTPASGAEG